MNAEEFRDTTRTLKDVIGVIAGRRFTDTDRGYALLNLKQAWAKLDKHRLEMEAAQPVDGTENVMAPLALVNRDELDRRFGVIEERVNRIESAIENFFSEREDHSERLDEIERTAKLTDEQIAVHQVWLRHLDPHYVPPDKPLAPAEAAPPIEVKMRTRKIGRGALANGYWITGPRAVVGRSSSDEKDSRKAGEEWLADLSKHLGVPLKADWVESDET